jgi:hypothetical protein
MTCGEGLVCNLLPAEAYVRDLVQYRKLFIGKLKEILISNSFYSVDEFLLYCKDL